MAYTKLKLGREKGVRHAALGFCRGRAAQPAFSPFSYVQQTKKDHPWDDLFCLAERKGFEPLMTFLPYTISSRAPSTNSAISPHIRLFALAQRNHA